MPEIPNPDNRAWHALTRAAWAEAWASPMAGQWIDADVHALGRLAVLWDAFYQAPAAGLLAEIRLQEARFGLSPLDRARLQWDIPRPGDAAGDADPSETAATPKRRADPRVLFLAKK